MRRFLPPLIFAMCSAGAAMAASLASTTYPKLALEHIQSAGVMLGTCSGVAPVVVPANGAQDARCLHTVAQFCVPALDSTVAPKCFIVDRLTKPANVPTVLALLAA